MKQRIGILLLLICAPLLLWSATQSKHKTFTKKYKDARLESVIQEIAKKTDYVLQYDAEDIDAERLVSANFKDISARSAYRKLLGKEYDITVKKNVITLTRKPSPPTQYMVVAQQPSRVEDDSLMTVRYYEDTTYTVACRKVTHVIESDNEDAKRIKKKASDSRKGHYVQVLLGAGYGSMGYSLNVPDGQNAKVVGGFGGGLQVQYAYYFHENWGVTAGLGWSGYTSAGTLNIEKRWLGQKDSDGERYDHIATTTDWREKQQLHTLDIPIGLQCQYPLRENLRIYAGAGMRIGVPVVKTYQLQSGVLRHEGYYPQWNMLMSSGLEDRDFYEETIGADFSRDKKSLSLQSVSVGLMADLGVMIALNKQLDLMVGVYGQVSANNMRKDGLAMGWQQDSYTGAQAYRNHTFMNAYAGAMASEFCAASRPYQVGIKVGISWHHAPKPIQGPPFYELVQVCDTSYTLVSRTDTIMKPQRESAKAIERLMKKSVIWFDLDSYVPILQPSDIIDRIAEILLANPEQKILVNGHASREGSVLRNQRLSENRAKAVATLLRDKGVREEQISVRGLGTSIDYQTEDGVEHTISLDRRVEIIPVD